MDKQVFSDGIGQVTIIGGAVRLDLVAYSATEKDAKGQPLAVLCQRVVMSIEGFMQAAQKIHETAQAITQLGQRPREGQPAEPTAAEAAAAPTKPMPPKRPFP